MFTDRTDAGRRLASLLVDHEVAADVVLGVSRGGVPVARVVADRLDTPLDVVVVEKLGAPSNPEFALGAVTAEGTVWLDESTLSEVGLDEGALTDRVESARRAAEESRRLFRGDGESPSLADRTVVIVDDGIATGATISACVEQVRAAGARTVVVAAPVAPPWVVESLYGPADSVLVLETPPHFRAVGAYYDDFSQVSDEAVRSALDG